jgi:hypothetical protein
MKRLLIGLAVITALSVAAVPMASPYVLAADTTQQSTVEPIEIPVSTVVRGANRSEHELATRTIANGEYKLTVEAVNQDSEHPNTDIIVRSGQSELTVKDVEHKAFSKETANGTLTVESSEVAVYVMLGADEVFSGGVKVVLTYVPPVIPEEPKPEEPEIPETPGEQPETLPVTGPTDVLKLAAFAGVGGYASHRFLRRRK